MKSINLLLMAGLAIPGIAAADESQLTPSQQQEVRELVRDTLVNNPEILKEAFLALQQHETQAQANALVDTIKANEKALFNSPSDPWLGAKDPLLTLVYFTDYNCPYCKRFEPELMRMIKEFPQVKLVIKAAPILGASSVEAARLSQDVWLEDKDKYFELHEKLMAKPGRHSSSSIRTAADITGTEEWVGETSQQANEAIDANLELFRKLGLNGTPATLIGGQIVPGYIGYDQLKGMLEEQLAKAEG